MPRSRIPGLGLDVRESVCVHRIERMVWLGNGFFRSTRTKPELAAHTALLKCAIRRSIHSSRRAPVWCIAMRAVNADACSFANGWTAQTAASRERRPLSGSSATPEAEITNPRARGTAGCESRGRRPEVQWRITALGQQFPLSERDVEESGSWEAEEEMFS